MLGSSVDPVDPMDPVGRTKGIIFLLLLFIHLATYLGHEDPLRILA